MAYGRKSRVPSGKGMSQAGKSLMVRKSGPKKGKTYARPHKAAQPSTTGKKVARATSGKASRKLARR